MLEYWSTESIYCSHLDCSCDEGRKLQKDTQEEKTVGSGDILKPLSLVPPPPSSTPEVPQTAVFCPDVPLLSENRVLV